MGNAKNNYEAFLKAIADKLAGNFPGELPTPKNEYEKLLKAIAEATGEVKSLKEYTFAFRYLSEGEGTSKELKTSPITIITDVDIEAEDITTLTEFLTSFYTEDWEAFQKDISWREANTASETTLYTGHFGSLCAIDDPTAGDFMAYFFDYSDSTATSIMPTPLILDPADVRVDMIGKREI